MHWQEVIALGIVAAAAAYLARCAWRTIAGKRAGGCGSCSTCPENKATNKTPLVQIGSKPNR